MRKALVRIPFAQLLGQRLPSRRALLVKHETRREAEVCRCYGQLPAVDIGLIGNTENGDEDTFESLTALNLKLELDA